VLACLSYAAIGAVILESPRIAKLVEVAFHGLLQLQVAGSTDKRRGALYRFPPAAFNIPFLCCV
jgi:hypothetical protein